MKNSRVKMQIIMTIFIIALCAFFECLQVNANSQVLHPNVVCYEAQKGDGFSANNCVDLFCYGKNELGSFSVEGVTINEGTYNSVEAYGASGELVLSYGYDGSCQNDVKETWNLSSSSEKIVDDVSISKKVGKGAIIVQRSTDSVEWETVYTLSDAFNNRKSAILDFYTIDSSDVKAGMYYRVYVAYEMQKKIGTSTTAYVIQTDDYEYKAFLEKYYFYVCYDNNPIMLKDIMTGQDVSAVSNVDCGFIVDKNGVNCNVSIMKNSGYVRTIDDLTSITEPGSYNITATTQLGTKYNFYLKIDSGMTTAIMKPTVYEGGKDGKYDTSNPIYGNTLYEMSSLSSLTIAHHSDNRISESVKDGKKAYGITGDSVSIFLKLNDPASLEKYGWQVCSDTWGEKKNKQTIDGVYVGEIGTGALIVQKYNEETGWENIDAGQYTNGLFTTDFYTYYGENGETLIYTPDGKELLNGITLRILYAYEVYSEKTKIYDRCLEEYVFYLCNNELGAVTFHNLSSNEKLEEFLGDSEEDIAELFKKAETLTSGSFTSTGFTIDTSLNPTVDYTVTRDGVPIVVSKDYEYKITGKYVIELISALGDSEKVVIYVNNQSPSQAKTTYFGDGFITGKRIYSDGDYPVFEAGFSTYSIESVKESYMPICGTIENISTGEIIEIKPTGESYSGTFTTPGFYEATFKTALSDDEVASGDYFLFTYRFYIISEGTAPGPVVNHNNLLNYNKCNVSDAYPMYYALIFKSAGKGNITLAFSDEQSAKDFAYEYEKSTVIVQDDGTCRYSSSFIVEDKDIYDSVWLLTDDLYEYSAAAVRKKFFDLSEKYTYTTLSDIDIDAIDNLRTLELNDDVTIFADGQKELLCSKNNIPVINSKPYVYLAINRDGVVSSGKNDFEFISDMYGCDSSQVIITDCNGIEYEINYNESVEEQLAYRNCPSGIIHITERTVYGDETTYDAIYFANGDNTAQVNINYYLDGEEKQITVDRVSKDVSISVDAFWISSIVDSLDPYSIVRVSHPDWAKPQYCVADQVSNDVWTEKGEYDVTVVNRLGFSYSFNVNIENSSYVSISFSGQGCDNAKSILALFGEKHITLPTLYQEGYTHIGFRDEDGNEYNTEIETINFKGNKILTPLWEPNVYKIYLMDINGNLIDTLDVTYGKTVELPKPIMMEGYTFDGWLRDGALIEGNVYLANIPNDAYLVAKVSGGDGGGVVIASKNAKVTTIVCFVIFVGGTLVGVWVYINKSQSELKRLTVEDISDSDERSEDIGMEQLLKEDSEKLEVGADEDKTEE